MCKKKFHKEQKKAINLNKYGKMLDNYEVFFYDKGREGRGKTNK